MATRASHPRSRGTKKKTKKKAAKAKRERQAVLDPATGEPLPRMLTYEEFADLWPMGLSTLRRKVSEGWVRVQRTSHSLVHITRAEFLRLRAECQEQAGEPVKPEPKPKAKRSRRRS